MEVHPMFQIFYFFIIFGTLTNLTIAREEWVDPHDMNIRIKHIRKEKIESMNNEESNSCYCNNNFYKDESSNHLRKVVSLLTDMTHFDRRSYVYRGIIDINLKADDYDFLKKYVSADWNEDFVLSQLSAVLEKSLGKSIYSHFTIGEYIYLTIFNENVLLCFGLLILSYVMWRIQPQNYKLTTLFKMFFPLVYLSDFVLRYKAKLEEVEVDKYLQFENFKSCDPDRLGYFDWFLNIFTGYCQKEKRNFLLSQRAAFHIFTPLNIISDQFDVFVNIFKHLGAGLGSFIWALIEQVPWYVKPFLALFSFVLVIIILLMLGSYILGIYPKFNLFHVFQFELLQRHPDNENHTNRAPQKDFISGENLKILLESRNNNPVVILPGSSNQKKNSSLTFRTKPKFSLRKRKPRVASSCNLQVESSTQDRINEPETEEKSIKNLSID